ncbi:MAG TPA: c-type cytochrome [Bryobacteraceae bacterium]|nr:c-type cytochrome [Bryobacteraceae bacterium]
MIWLAVLLLARGFAAPAAAQSAGAAPPAQAERGQTLFFGDGKCSSCHAVKGRGTAVGPNLSGIARLSPRAVAMAVRSTRTQYVQAVKTKEKEFPGMKASEDEKTVHFFDLSQTPPAAVSLAKGEFTATDNQTWKHPPASAELTNEQMADVVAFLRWAFLNDKKEIDPTEVQ